MTNSAIMAVISHCQPLLAIIAIISRLGTLLKMYPALVYAMR